MNNLFTYSVRIFIVALSFYFLGKELWLGKEGLHECMMLKEEIDQILVKKRRLEEKIATLNKELTYFNDPEFLAEQQARKNDLKKKGDLLYLI